jgi:hypothetical protein
MVENPGQEVRSCGDVILLHPQTIKIAKYFNDDDYDDNNNNNE